MADQGQPPPLHHFVAAPQEWPFTGAQLAQPVASRVAEAGGPVVGEKLHTPTASGLVELMVIGVTRHLLTIAAAGHHLEVVALYVADLAG